MWRDFKLKENIKDVNKEEETKRQVIKRKVDVHLHVKIAKDGSRKVNIVEDTKSNYLRKVDIEESQKKETAGGNQMIVEELKEVAKETKALHLENIEPAQKEVDSIQKDEEVTKEKNANLQEDEGNSNHGSEDNLNIEANKKDLT